MFEPNMLFRLPKGLFCDTKSIAIERELVNEMYCNMGSMTDNASNRTSMSHHFKSLYQYIVLFHFAKNIIIVIGKNKMTSTYVILTNSGKKSSVS